MAAASQQSSARNIRNDHLRLSTSLKIPVLVREADNATGLGDVDPARFRAERVERDVERAVETGGEHLVHLRFSGPVFRAQHAHAPGTALREEDVPIGSCSDQTRILQTGLKLFDSEAVRRAWPRIGGTRHDPRAAVDGLRREWRRQIGQRDPAPNARRIGRPVAERALAGENLGRLCLPRGRRRLRSKESCRQAQRGAEKNRCERAKFSSPTHRESFRKHRDRISALDCGRADLVASCSETHTSSFWIRAARARAPFSTTARGRWPFSPASRWLRGSRLPTASSTIPPPFGKASRAL